MTDSVLCQAALVNRQPRRGQAEMACQLRNQLRLATWMTLPEGVVGVDRSETLARIG